MPQPKLEKSIEQLMDEEFEIAAELEEEAELESLAEQELELQTSPNLETVAQNYDPRYMEVINDYCRKKENILERIKWAIKNEEFDTGNFIVGWSIAGSLIGMALGSIMAYILMKDSIPITDFTTYNHYVMYPQLASCLAGLVGGLGFSLKTLKKRKGEIKDKKGKKIVQLEQELDDLEAIVSPYEKRCAEGNVVVIDDEELGCSLGYVKNGKINLEYLKGKKVAKEELEINEAQVLAVLGKGHELSEDDLKALKEKTPVCYEKDSKLKFGFVTANKEGFGLHANYSCHRYSHSCSFDDDVTVYQLIPVLAPEDKPEGYRINATA